MSAEEAKIYPGPLTSVWRALRWSLLLHVILAAAFVWHLVAMH